MMNLRNLFWLIMLASLWGPSFLFIKVAVADIPPLTLVLGRVGIGAVLLTLLLWFRGQQLPRSWQVWRRLAFMALVQTTIPFVLFAWGEQYIDSALASIFNGATPLFTILLAHFFVADDRLNLAKSVGVVVGFGGLILLILPAIQTGVTATFWGLLAVAAAAALYGAAMIYSRLHLRGLPSLVAPTGQMLMTTLYLLPLSLLWERPYTIPMPSLASFASLAALGVLGTAVAFVVFYHLVEIADPSYVSMVTYLIPVIGVILGVAVLGERLTWFAYAGSLLILLGVLFVNGLPGWRMGWLRRPKRRPDFSEGSCD